MPDMTPAQQESISSLLRILGAAGLAGAGARAGFGVLRNANNAYDPPEVPKPLIVDMPYASREAPPSGQIPIPKKTKELKPDPGMAFAPEKAAGLEATIRSLPLGDRLWEGLPSSVPMGGHPGATNPMEVPAYGAALPAAVALGGGGGYMLADKILRAADRRGARKDVDAAQEEYRQAILDRITKTQSGKVAADLVKMASDQTPEDADLRRAKTALDLAFAARTKQAEADLSGNALKSWLYPGTAIGPEAATLNMIAAGTLGAVGGYSGYRASREQDEAAQVRERIKALDRLNAKKIKPPVVARLVPVTPDKL